MNIEHESTLSTGRYVRTDPIIETSLFRPSSSLNTRSTLQELLADRHHMSTETQDDARAHLDVPQDDRPPTVADDMFIPEPDQIRASWSQWDDTTVYNEPEIWLHAGK